MKNLLLFISTILTSFTLTAQNNLLIQTSEVHHLMQNYESDRGSLMRFYTVSNSPERRERFKKFNEDYLQQLNSLAFDKMSQGGKVDYLLFKRRIENELRTLQIEETEYNAIKKYLGFSDYIYKLEKLRRRGTSMDGAEVAKSLNDLQKQIIAANASLKKEQPIERALSIRASNAVTGLQDALKNTYQFYDDYDPLFTWWVEKPYQKNDSPLKAYATH